MLGCGVLVRRGNLRWLGPFCLSHRVLREIPRWMSLPAHETGVALWFAQGAERIDLLVGPSRSPTVCQPLALGLLLLLGCGVLVLLGRFAFHP